MLPAEPSICHGKEWPLASPQRVSSPEEDSEADSLHLQQFVRNTAEQSANKPGDAGSAFVATGNPRALGKAGCVFERCKNKFVRRELDMPHTLGSARLGSLAREVQCTFGPVAPRGTPLGSILHFFSFSPLPVARGVWYVGGGRVLHRGRFW